MQPHPQIVANPPTTPKLPSAFALFGKSIEALGVNLAALVGLIVALLVLIITFIVIGALATVPRPSAEADNFLAALVVSGAVAAVSAYIVVSPAMTAILLKGALGEKLGFKQSLHWGLRFAWRYLGLSICTGLLTFVGFLLLIVPGLFLLHRYRLAGYYLIDRNIGVFEAMRCSAADAKRFSGPIWGLVGVEMLVGIGGNLVFVGPILQIMYLGAPAARYVEITRGLPNTLPPLGGAPTPLPPLPEPPRA